MLEKYEEILNIDDICEILNICRNTATKLIQEKIKHKRIGRKYIILKKDLIEFLDQ